MILNAAMSIDGKIATKNGRARISSQEDLNRMQRLRASVDAIMIGVNTLLIDNPSLRLKGSTSEIPPTRIVVDSSLRTPLDSRIFSFPGRIIICASEKADRRKMARFSEKAEIIIAGRDRVDMGVLLSELAERGVRRILLEGGGNPNWSMMEAGLVDEVRIAIAPVVIGGRDTVTLVEGEGVPCMEKAFQFEFIDASMCGRDVVLSFEIKGE